jgi:predicted TPR repeat methyltransferase
MPVSTPCHISHCVQLITGINPKSVLDVGCGFGLWGFLCREYLDVWNGRVLPGRWEVKIDGIELFEPYIQAHQRAIYSNIRVCDIRDAVESLPEYDLVIAGDVIEHLDKPDAEVVLERLYEKAQKALLINIPLQGNWEHPEANGNPGELHRSQWTENDFMQFAPEIQTFDFGFGYYGVFLCRKNLSIQERVNGLRHAAQSRESRDDLTGALKYLVRASELAPADSDAAMHLADVHLRCGRLADAANVLRAAVNANASFAYGRLLLARILLLVHMKEEARDELSALIAQDGVDAEVAGQARDLLEKMGEGGR